MSATWVAAKAVPIPDQAQDSKVNLRDNPLAADKDVEDNAANAKKTSVGHPSRLNRVAVKADVLKTYTTNQPIASFIDVDEGLSEDQRARMKAERLGSTSEGSGQRVTGNSQVELIAHVEGLDKQLRNHWKHGEKVRSTRVAIQAIKMLCNPKVPQCYPSIFMLVSSVMDTFGDFVAKRLQELSANGNAVVATLLKKGQDADADLIPPEAVEVCNNWFLKISSIRELVPRICVELSLLKCFRYVSKKMRSAMPEVVERLAGQIRGIADPLVASHIRWYLFLRAQEVLHGSEWAAPLTQCYLDQLQMMAAIKYPGALTLYAPSIQWMLDTLLANGSSDERQLIISKTVEHVLSFNNAAMTAVLFRALSVKELAAIGFDNLLAHISSFKDYQERATALSAFCLAFVDGEVPGANRGAKTAFLSEIHGVAELETVPVAQFMVMSEALLLLCAAHFGPKQIHVMLRLMREKLVDEAQSTIETPLCDLFARLLAHFSPGPLLTSPDLVPLVRMASIAGRGAIITNLLRAIPFGNEGLATVALELCRILEQCQAIGSDNTEYTTIVAKTLVAVCPVDLEGKIAFLCEARHTLSDAERLRAALIHIALRAIEDLNMSARKRRNAAKVLFAFVHVTTPALQSPFTRLKVGLLATAVAFKKGLVSYGEGLMHLCVGILSELEPFTTLTDGTVEANDNATKDIALQMISIAALVPPHRKYGHLYLFESILQWTDKYQWPISSTAKYAIWFAIVRIATRLMRNDIAYSFPLCGTSHNHSDPAFAEAAEAAAIAAMKRALFHTNRIHQDSPQLPLLHDICLEGFETVLNFGVHSKSLFARCAGAYFWKVGKEARSGVVTPLFETARNNCVVKSSEHEVNEVVYYDHRKDLVFEKMGVRMNTEDESGVIGAADRSNAADGPLIATPQNHQPQAGPSGPAGSSTRNHVDPNAPATGDDEADALAAAENATELPVAPIVEAGDMDDLEAAENGGGGNEVDELEAAEAAAAAEEDL